MPERDIDPGFERQLEQQLRAYAEQGVRRFDAVEIAHTAALGRRGTRAAPSTPGRLIPAPVMWIALTAVLLVALTATAFAAGLLPLPVPVIDPSPSPTTAAVSPSPTQPAPTESPIVEPPPSPTTSPPSVTPTPSPQISPTAEPTAAPLPSPATIGEWREVTNFPLGDGPFVVVRAVTAAGPGFVAVGLVSDGAGNIEGGRAWTSPDGQSWDVVPSEAFAGAKLEVVVEHLGVLYAFGPIPTDDEDYPDLGAYNIWRSSDGQDWQLLPQPSAFADDAIVAGATIAGETLVAWGYRNVIEGADTVVRPGVWTWSPTAGGDWRLADTLPNTYDIQRMAYANGTLVAIGNDRDDPPWRSIWNSTDEGRTWAAVDAPFIDDPNVNIEDVAAVVDPAPDAHPGGVYVAVGYQGRRDDILPVALGTTYQRDWFNGGSLDGFVMHQMERVVAIPGGFLALGNEMRFEINPNCAPAPCEEHVSLGSRAWTAPAIGTRWANEFEGLDWQAASAPRPGISWYFAGIAVGESGIVVVGADSEFNRGVWFAPLTLP